jgi:hypothetical protein
MTVSILWQSVTSPRNIMDIAFFFIMLAGGAAPRRMDGTCYSQQEVWEHTHPSNSSTYYSYS